MKHRMLIPIEPISINKVHCRDVRYYTVAFREFAANVLHHLNSPRNQKAIAGIQESFNPQENYFRVTMKSYYPREQMFTKADAISSKTQDVSNIEKPLIDVVFTKKFHGSDTVMKGKNINIDDKYIKALTSLQLVGDSHLIELTVEIRPLSELDQTA